MAINDQNQQQSSPNQPRQLGSGFTNLQNIMQANTGNKLGQAVGSGIQQTGQQAQSALNSGVQDFNTQSQANALGTQAQKQNVQDVLNNAGNVTSQNVSDFANYRTGQYSGPTDISNISGIANQAKNAQQQGQEVGTSGGRQALLQQYAAGPNKSYNAGQQNLDNLLLGATGGKQLQQARQSVSGLTNQVQGAQTTAQQQAQQLQNQAQGFGKQVTQQVQGAQNAIYNPAQQAAQQANIAEQQGMTAEQTAAQNAQNNQLSAAAIQALGLNAGRQTYGVNLGQYIGYTPQNEQATALNVMAQPDFQKYTGLQQLMGQTPSAAPQTAYQAGQTTYDQAGANAAIAGKEAQYNPLYNEFAAAQGNVQSANANGSGNAFARILLQQAAQDRYNRAKTAMDQWTGQNNGVISQIN